MKKQLLYVAALCASFSMHAAVVEKYDMQNLMQEFMNAQIQFITKQFEVHVVFLLNAPSMIHGATIEQVEQTIHENFDPLKNIPQEESEEAMIKTMHADILKHVVSEIATVVRKNQMPAIDTKELKRGVDVQANRLKVLELIEASLR